MLTYHKLARRLDRIVSGEDAYADCLRSGRPTVAAAPPVRRQEPVPNANWFHFATWATLAVTQNIGNERGPQRLNSGIGAPLRRRLTPAIARAKSTDEQRVGRALAWGQRLVFITLTHVMQVFDATHRGVSTEERKQAEDAAIERIRYLVGPDPDHWLIVQRHVTPLWRAFEWYRLAKDESSPERRAC